jgi:hypothetical protein
MPPPKPLAHISPSQIKTQRSCPTKWWAEKRLGLRSPSTDATRFGGVLHAVAECYLLPLPEEEHLDYIYKTTKSDTDPPPTKADIGRAWGLLKHNISLGLLPTPGEGAVEGEVEKVLPSRIKLKGRFDHLGVVVDPETGELCPVVTDHKTTSSPNYAESEETLRTNVQTIVYGQHGLENMPLAPKVCVRFVYYQTKQRKHGWRVEVWLTREEVQRGWDALDEEAKQMLAWYNEDDIEKIPRVVSEASCRAFYRDCPARRVCPAHKPKQTSFLDSVVQDARNQAVKAKPLESTMSTPDVFAPRNSQVVNAFFKNPAKQAEEGYSAEQAQVLLDEYNAKEGWALDPSVQSKTKIIDIIRAGIAVIRGRAVRAATNKAAVSNIAAALFVVATRQLNDDELGLVELLATAYSFPEEVAMGLVRTRPVEAQQIVDDEVSYAAWAEENGQPDMTPEREVPAAPAPRSTKAPAASKAKADPEPEVDVEETEGDGFSATAAVARAMQVDATLIKGLATTLKPKGLTIEEGLSALIATYGGKALSGAELKEAIKGSLSIERVRETHINAVFLLLGQGGDILNVPTLDGQDPVVADFDPVAYLKANYPALAGNAALRSAVEDLDNPEGVVEAVNAHAKSSQAPPVRTRAEAAALSAPLADEPAPAKKAAAKAAPAPEPEPVPVEEVVSGDEDLYVLVDSILVDGSAVSLDAIYDDMVRNYIAAFGVHPDGVKYNEGRAAVALEFRNASAEAMAGGGWFTVRSNGAAYAAVNGTFDGAVVIAGMR